jgi:hypothetical protein
VKGALSVNNKIVRVKTWEEFKQLIVKYSPKSIAYNIEQGVPARHLTGLRLILPVESIQYVFIDTNKKNRLRKTGIPMHKNGSGNLYIQDSDVIEFVRTSTKKKDLELHSYWTI